MQKRLFFLMAMLVTTLTMMAQVTTAGMGGKVTIEGTNETVIGATVQAVAVSTFKVCVRVVPTLLLFLTLVSSQRPSKG